MIIIIGALIVVGSVLGGYMMAGGQLVVLWHISEVVIIGGAALGAMIIMSPKKVLIDLAKSISVALKGAPYNQIAYEELLKALYELFLLGRRNGMIALEEHVMNPQSSSIFDRSHKPIFQPDSIQFTDYGHWVFSTLAWEISRYTTFAIELEGHTERGHAALRADYGDWELSADRANAARRKLLLSGVQNQQIHKVAGFADTIPMPGCKSEDESNRRVTVLLKVRSSKPS